MSPCPHHARFPLSPSAVLAAVLSLTACGTDQPAEPNPEIQPPDVVIFLVDTLRADWTQPGGFDRESTPHLANLADQAVTFEQASAAAPWTLPSVVSLFTGKHLAEHNVVHDRLRMAENTVTFPQLLQEWGYQTISYHRNPYAGGKWGLQRGFDKVTLTRSQIGQDELAGFYETLTDMPFFLYIHNTQPHDPHVVRKKFFGSFTPVREGFVKEYGELVAEYRKSTREDYVKKVPLGTIENTNEQEVWMRRLHRLTREVKNLYTISVRDADDYLGKVIEQLVDEGRWDNTLLIVVADHGEEMGDHGGWQHDQSAYEELIHVPFIVRFPNDEFAGQRISTPVSLVDVMPTLLEAVGCPLEQPAMSGRSLLPLIRGQEPSADDTRIVSIRNNMKKFYKPYKESRGDLNVVVRRGELKAIFNIEPNTLELYDLAADPLEKQDLAASKKHLADELRLFAGREYARMLENSDQAQAGTLNNQSAATLEALQALGYMGEEESPPKDD